MAFDTSGIRLKPCVDLFSTEASRQDASLEKIREIPLDQLVPFKDHPFKVIDDESMMDTVQKMDLPKDTIVTWVTMPDKRRRKRGIDHGRVLAQCVAQRMNVPCLKLLIRREESRHTQEGLSREQRLRNLEGVFDAIPLNGENVLLVDDVHTTGATALFCTRALLSRGARSVWVLTATGAQEDKQEENTHS